jgi:hypothetical protein
MLERGWVRCENFNLLKTGQTGLLKIDDGPEIFIIVSHGPHMENGMLRITVRQPLGTGENESKPFDLFQREQFRSWDIYFRTEPVPFIPTQPQRQGEGKGGYKKTRGKKSRVKTSKRGTKAKKGKKAKSKNTRRKA